MRSLGIISQQNCEAVVESNPDRLTDVWPEGQPVTEINGDETESAHTRRHGNIFFTSEAILGFAELGLGFNLDHLRRGVTTVLQAERGTRDIELQPLTLFAFILASAPELVAEWTEALEAKVARYADCPDPSFTIRDHAHGGIRIRIVNRVVEKILPPRRPKSS